MASQWPSPRLVKIFEPAFLLEVISLPSPTLRLVFRSTLIHTQRSYGRHRLRRELMDWKHLLAYITGITRWKEYTLARDARHLVRHTNTNGHPEGWPSSLFALLLEQPPVRATPYWLSRGNQRSSCLTTEPIKSQEERYSGYFSCFVTRTIILCLPPRSLRPGSTGTYSLMPSLALRPATR